jgi:hypothetical protein
MENVWGTRNEGIGTSLTNALGEQVPMHGGRLVECVITASGKVLRASDGWVLELCDTALHIRRIGSSVHACADLDLLVHAGGEPTPSENEISAANVIDRMNYRAGMANLVRRLRETEESKLDAEFDRLFDALKESPHVEYTVSAS